MNPTDELILEEYRRHKPEFLQIETHVSNILSDILKKVGIEAQTLPVEHRVKGEKSLIGKLIRYDGYFRTFTELTDILGARVICFFEDDVDVVGKEVEKAFDIDWEHSSDKRKLIQSETFGYLSLHYICSLPKNGEYPEELTNWQFEIQIRTILQHAWAAINHDIGYKSEFGVPREFRRGFARLAGLLELADNEFVRMRDGMKDYSKEVRQSIIDGSAEDIPLNMVSINEFLRTNSAMASLISDIASICGSEMEYTDAVSYIGPLSWLKVTTVGDLTRLLTANRDAALALAQSALAGTELDILSSNVALRFLCHAELLRSGCTRNQIIEFLQLSAKNPSRIEGQADRILARKKLLIEKKLLPEA